MCRDSRFSIPAKKRKFARHADSPVFLPRPVYAFPAENIRRHGGSDPRRGTVRR